LDLYPGGAAIYIGIPLFKRLPDPFISP